MSRIVRENEEAVAIRELAAKILGWDYENTETFSISMLREMVLGKDHPDTKRLIKAIDYAHTNDPPLWLNKSIYK
jgi:hypothetical protein